MSALQVTEWMREALVFAIVALIFAGQSVLCFQVRRVWLRLIPVEVLAILTAVLFVCVLFSQGWDAIGFLLLFLYALLSLLACGLAWAVWGGVAIIRRLLAKK